MEIYTFANMYEYFFILMYICLIKRSNLKGFNFYYFKACSHAHIVSDILDDTAFCILGENYYSTATKVEGQMYISNVVGNGDITFNNNVVTINIADKFGIIISNKEITIK